MTNADLLASDDGPWVADRKALIHSAQELEARSVRCECVLLYWQIGRTIRKQWGRECWGTMVSERLSQDPRSAVLEMKGMSPCNLKSMRAIAQARPEPDVVQNVPAQLPWNHRRTESLAEDPQTSLLRIELIERTPVNPAGGEPMP